MVTASELPVVVFAPDLLDRSRIAGVLAGAVFARRADELPAMAARYVLVDLSRPGVLDVIPHIAAPVIGFGPHVDDELLAAGMAAGCTEVLPRSRVFRRLESL